MSSDYVDRKSRGGNDQAGDAQRQFNRHLNKNFRKGPRTFGNPGRNPAKPNATDSAGLSFGGTNGESSAEALEEVRSYCFYFKQALYGKSAAEVNSFYETDFSKITEKNFMTSSWPAAELISSAVGDDGVFLTLYKELFYRHIYAKMKPTFEQREASWDNYLELFNYFLDMEGDDQITLPGQWIWDMIDEFIYQFQTFCQYRSNLKGKLPEEIEKLRRSEAVWNPATVIFYLESLMKKGAASEEAEKQKQTSAPTHEALGKNSVTKLLSYFSIIGLVRVHTLFGDYYLALKTMESIDLNKKGLFSRVTACHITTYYYYGFANLMLRKYVEAIKCFNNILLYIARTKAHYPRSYQFDQILKKNDQMYALLGMAISLWPQRVDETVMQGLRERLTDKLVRLQKGEEKVYSELFIFACPKFISPCIPTYEEEEPTSAGQESLLLQLNIFLGEVKQQSSLYAIRSYLKLYTSIGLEKLAGFMETEPEKLRTLLLCYKHKSRTLSQTAGGGSKWITASDVDFYIDGHDMIHIGDTRTTKRQADYFLRHITKFEEILAEFDADK